MATDMRSLGEPPPAGEAFAPADGLLHDLTVLLVAVTASRPVHVGLDLDRAMAGLRLADVLEPAGARRLWLPSGRLLGEGDEVRPLVDWRERLRLRIHRPDTNHRGARWSVVVQGRPAMWPLDADREGDLIFTLLALRRLLGEPHRGEFGWTIRRPDGGRWDVLGDWLRDDPVIPGVQVRTRCPLCAALDEGDEAAARHAMFHHVGLHRACDKSTPPTERLVTGGHADLIRDWLASGVFSTALGRWGMPAQHIAARHNRLDVIKVLAEAGVKLVGHRGDDGSLLHAALKARGHDVARWLVARGADVEVPGSRGRRPLHVAAERGSVDLVRDLIAAGADVHARDDAGRTPLLALGERNAAEVARLLIDAGARVDVVDASDYSPLRHAAAEREPEALLQVLLAAGAEVDAAGDDGGTALYAAAGSRRLAAVRFLIAAGARPDGVRGGGLTPLQLSVMIKFDYGRSEVALALIAAGADVHARDAEGNTVLHWAAAHGRTAVVLALLDAGAACDEPDSRGVRPIERAVRGGKPAMIEALRRAGADMRGCREQALTQALRKPSRRTLGGLRAVLGAEDRLGPAERLALRRRLGPRSPESACAGDAELAAWLRAALGW